MKKFNIYILWTLCIIFCFIEIYTFYYHMNDNFPLTPSPEIKTAKPFDYYRITDETGTIELMTVSVQVYIGDEVLAEDNSLYEVVKLDGNHAFAKFVKKIHL